MSANVIMINRPLLHTCCIKLYLVKYNFGAGRRKTVTLFKFNSSRSFSLFFFQTLKNFYLNYHKNESADPGVFLLLACGTASSTCGQLASYPLSLVRTRLQAQGME